MKTGYFEAFLAMGTIVFLDPYEKALEHSLEPGFVNFFLLKGKVVSVK